jgi:hypothetical protein
MAIPVHKKALEKQLTSDDAFPDNNERFMSLFYKQKN